MPQHSSTSNTGRGDLWLFRLRRRQLADLFKVRLHVLLIGQRHFVAVDFAARIGVPSPALAVLRAQLLAAGRHLDHHLARHVLRSLPEDLADLAHGRELFRFLDALVAVLSSDAALAILRIAALVALAVALALPRFGLLAPLRILARLAVGRRHRSEEYTSELQSHSFI